MYGNPPPPQNPYGSQFPGYPAAPPPPPRRSLWPWIVAGAAVLLGTCGGGVAFCTYSLSSSSGDDQHGVTMGTQLPDKVAEELRTRGLLQEGEVLVVYYDATVSLDMSEVSFLTNRRVVNATGGKVVSFDLADVVSARHTKEGIVGDVLEVAASDGRRLRIEVAPFNGGPSFAAALDDELAKQPAKVKVMHVE